MNDAFQVMFWGIREAKRIQLMAVDKPRVEIELAGNVVKSKPIIHMNKNSNFENPLTYIDVDLPEDVMYWPPIIIRCFDCRNFGREVSFQVMTCTQSQCLVIVIPSTIISSLCHQGAL